MRTDRRFAQVDVFSPAPGRGNPLAVVQADAQLDEATMQAMAAWFDFAETTFLLPPTQAGADYRLRIFTARQEIAFAGHPSIGSAFAAVALGVLPRPASGRLRQECKAGVLPLRLEEEGRAWVQVPRSRRIAPPPVAGRLLRAALGDRRLGGTPPSLVEGGRRWWLAELADEGQVRRMQPDEAAILALARATDSLGLCVFARTPGGETDLVVRAFPLGVGLREDPASGAANAAIAAFLEESQALGALGRRFQVSQGREMGRDARLSLEIDAEQQVWVGGQCHLVVDGRVHW
jgi:PhzF family phenazine biosynthesis protein